MICRYFHGILVCWYKNICLISIPVQIKYLYIDFIPVYFPALIPTKSCQAFPRYKHSKISLVPWFCFFSFYSSRCENYHKAETGSTIALKFGTQKGGVNAHLCITFNWNTINTHKVICDYSQKVTPISTLIMLSRPQNKLHIARS